MPNYDAIIIGTGQMMDLRFPPVQANQWIVV